METSDRKEADQVRRDKELPPGEQSRNAAEFSPGVHPESDRYGLPEEGAEEEYYPDYDPIAEGRKSVARPEPGGTSSDRRADINVDDLDRGDYPPRSD